MQLNKLHIGKSIETADKNNTLVKNNAQNKMQETSQVKFLQQPRSLSLLISSSGLPNDKLSASVLSLARFFSLSLKPEQLAAIRRQAMTQQQTQQAAEQTRDFVKTAADGSASVKAREVFSLAAAAAESKGIELKPNGLEYFTEAVDPDLKEKKDDNKHNRRKKQNQPENDDNEHITAVNIKRLALESADNNQFISILNKLPGKNGQRWIVLPFEFNDNGNEYHVSMRVLLEKENAKFMALNIISGIRDQGSGNREQRLGSREQGEKNREKRESFALMIENNKIKTLTYYFDNSFAYNEKIKNELATIFDLNIKNVFIKKKETWNMPLPEADYGEDMLQFIDEAV